MSEKKHYDVIAIGGGSLHRCSEFAAGLAKVLDNRGEKTLLMISSDMNHYASEVENRRVDLLALEALEALDPERLFRTVRENHISMCGVLPAVIVLESLRRMNRVHQAERVGYTTSAEVSGDSSRVVGYAGVLFS